MSKINNLNITQSPNFKGLNKMDRILQENPLDKFIENALSKLQLRAEREVPDYGGFTPVCEKYTNKDSALYAGNVKIQITKAPKSVPNHEKLRFLDIVVKSPSERSKSACIIASGDTKTILSKLKEEGLFDQIKTTIHELSQEMAEEHFS